MSAFRFLAVSFGFSLVLFACGGDGRNGGSQGARCGVIEGRVLGYLPTASRGCQPSRLEFATRLYRKDRVTTTLRGEVDFKTNQLAHCKVWRNGRVIIRPTHEVALRYERGRVWCQVKSQGRRVVLRVPGGTISVTGTIIGLEGTSDGTLVKMASGSAVVESSDEQAVLGMGKEMLAQRDGPLSEPETFIPDSTDDKLITLLRYNVVTIPSAALPDFVESKGEETVALITPNTATASGVESEVADVDLVKYTDEQVLETERPIERIDDAQLPVAVAGTFDGAEAVFAELRQNLGADIPIAFVPDIAIITEPPPTAPLQPTISIGDATVLETDRGSVTASFTVSLSTPATDQVTVDYETASRTATAGEDYETTAGTLRLEQGEMTKSIEVPVFGDTETEEQETFVVDLSNASGALISDHQGTGTINDGSGT